MLRVRTDPAESARTAPAEALRAEGGSIRVDAHTEIAASEHEPLLSVPRALLDRPAVRDALAAGIPVPSLAGLAKVRLATAVLAAFPLLWLLERDREELAAPDGSVGRLVLDLVLVAFTARELSRKTPQLPRIAAASLGAVALRAAFVAMQSCGRQVPLAVWTALALAAIACGVWLVRAPTAPRVALELAGRLGLERAALAHARPEEDREVPPLLFGAAVAAAIGLPAVLFVARRAHLALPAQAGILVAYAAIVPEIVKRIEPREGAGLVRPAALLGAVFVGLACAVALVSGADAFMKDGTELARCAGKLDAEGKRLALAQAREIAEAIRRVRTSTWLGVVAVAVVPLAEERIYRGVLLPVLVRRYGRAYGLFATSLAFAFAHAGVYELAVWQTALLGFAFGLAYLEGGLVAAFATHAIWNLLQMI